MTEIRHVNLCDSDFNYCALLQALIDFRAKGVVICESPNLEEDTLLMKATYCCLSQGYQCCDLEQNPLPVQTAYDSLLQTGECPGVKKYTLPLGITNYSLPQQEEPIAVNLKEPIAVNTKEPISVNLREPIKEPVIVTQLKQDDQKPKEKQSLSESAVPGCFWHSKPQQTTSVSTVTSEEQSDSRAITVTVRMTP